LILRAVVLSALLGAIGCGNNSTPTTPSSGSPPPTVPGITLSVSALNFTAQGVGTASTTQAVTITNGSTPVAVSSVAAIGDFTQTNTCGSSLAVGATCTVTVTFMPTAIGTRTGAVTITDDAATSPQVVALSGTGGIGQISLSPATVTFANLVIGTNATQTVVINNSGGASVTLAGINVSGDFTQINSCGTSLAANSTCAVSVKFSPTATGPRTGSLVVSDDAAGSPHTAPLLGTGLAQAPSVFPIQNPLTFPAQAVGTSSRPATAQFTNLGTSPLLLNGIAASGDFSQSNTCGNAIAPSGICSINVVFTPTAAGARTGAITITSNAPAGPQTIVLTGTGTDAASAQGPLAAVSPPGVTFVNQAVGSTSASQTVTLKNTGGSPLTISGISTLDDFVQSNACGGSLAPGVSCAIKVAFSPGAAGLHAGTLIVNDSAPGSPHTVLLSGTGTGGVIAPAVTLSSANVGFGTVRRGTTSDPQTVSIVNTGKATLSISSIGIEGDFSTTDNCGNSVPAGASCTLTLRFTPTAVGTRSGKVTIVDDAATSPQTIVLSGTGGQGQITLTPAVLTFVAQGITTTSDSQSVSVTNSGEVSMTILSVTASGDFAQTNTCTNPLGAGAACTITVTFTPQAAGTRTGSLTIVDDAPGSPHAVVLTGSGTN
jgi:hypothetical protein